tara:strand:+ start:160 stop:729 length:570 start_codon:yes stop_codon:yes gene_type:complete
MKNLLLIFSVLLSTSLSAVVYDSLQFFYDGGEYGPSDTKNTDFIILNEGDTLEVVDYCAIAQPSKEEFAETSSFLRAENQEGDLIYHKAFSYGNGAIRGSTLVGPCTAYLYTNYTGSVKSMNLIYKLTRASEVEYKNVNIVSLPSASVGQGTHNIVVEASDDLQSWTPVHSSSIGGDKTFFRTRVVEAE